MMIRKKNGCEVTLPSRKNIYEKSLFLNRRLFLLPRCPEHHPEVNSGQALPIKHSVDFR